MIKFKKIAAVCNKSKHIVILHQLQEDELVAQWIGDGAAFYPVTGLPLLTEENIFTLFDLNKKQREEYRFQQMVIPETYSFEDNVYREQPVKSNLLSFIRNGTVILPLHNQESIIFINERYLVPVYDADGYWALYERKSANGTPYIVAKNGLLISAVILPCQIRDDDFIKEMEQTARILRHEFRKSEMQGEGEERKQVAFW